MELIGFAMYATLAAWITYSVHRHAERLRDQLTLAQHTITVLAPKAQAWDEALASVKRNSGRPEGDALGNLLAARNLDTRVNYQHLSAECDGCDDAPARAQYDNLGGWSGGA